MGPLMGRLVLNQAKARYQKMTHGVLGAMNGANVPDHVEGESPTRRENASLQGMFIEQGWWYGMSKLS